MTSAHVTHWLHMALEHGIKFFMIHDECKLFFHGSKVRVSAPLG